MAAGSKNVTGSKVESVYSNQIRNAADTFRSMSTKPSHDANAISLVNSISTMSPAEMSNAILRVKNTVEGIANYAPADSAVSQYISDYILKGPNRRIGDYFGGPAAVNGLDADDIVSSFTGYGNGSAFYDYYGKKED